MKILILTQDDSFFIPHNIALLHKDFEIVGIVQIDSKYALANANMKKKFLHWFGLWQCGKMAAVLFTRKLLNLLDPLFCWKLLNGEGSLKHLAARYHLPFRLISNVNDPAFVEDVRKLDPDVICSYSAPQVIKEPLLSMPKYGNINVHGSLLPNFRGTLPSFWTIYKGAERLGATVHYMSAKIDDGKIILQGSAPAENVKTMFQAMKVTKEIGGKIMLEALHQIEDNKVTPKENDASQGEYYTWPTDEDVKDFRKKGLRFI